jgi:FtsK/SpoIIIE family/FtsK alpha domain
MEVAGKGPSLVSPERASTDDIALGMLAAETVAAAVLTQASVPAPVASILLSLAIVAVGWALGHALMRGLGKSVHGPMAVLLLVGGLVIGLVPFLYPLLGLLTLGGIAAFAFFCLRYGLWAEMVFVAGLLLLAVSGHAEMPALLPLGLALALNYTLAGKDGHWLQFLLALLTGLALTWLPELIGPGGYVVGAAICVFALAVRFSEHRWLRWLSASVLLLSLPWWEGPHSPPVFVGWALASVGAVILPAHLRPHHARAILTQATGRSIAHSTKKAAQATSKKSATDNSSIAATSSVRRLPPPQLLKPSPAPTRPSGWQLAKTAARIQSGLDKHGVDARIVRHSHGPAVFMFDLRLGEKLSLEELGARLADVAIAAGLERPLRAEVIHGERSMIRFELFRDNPDVVGLREMMLARPAGGLVVAIGQGANGKALYLDFDSPKSPHLLVLGTTGSGKTVGLVSIIMSLLMATPDARILICDPKYSEFLSLSTVPGVQIICDERALIDSLAVANEEVERRFRMFAEAGCKADAKTYRATTKKALPPLFLVIDEFTSMSETLPKRAKKGDEGYDRQVLQSLLGRLVQKGRAADVHVILATHSASESVISDGALSCFPARICFQVKSADCSKRVMGTADGVHLNGEGDMLVDLGNQRGRAQRARSPYVTEQESALVCSWAKDGALVVSTAIQAN